MASSLPGDQGGSSLVFTPPPLCLPTCPEAASSGMSTADEPLPRGPNRFMLAVVFNQDTGLADREFAVQAIQLPVALVRQGDLDLTRAADGADALHIWWRFSIEGEMSV